MQDVRRKYWQIRIYSVVLLARYLELYSAMVAELNIVVKVEIILYLFILNDLIFWMEVQIVENLPNVHCINHIMPCKYTNHYIHIEIIKAIFC